MPPRLMTATSVVPPPMSTMRLPDGSLTGSPAPIAAAIGSSMRRAQRAPALRAASRTARFSTSVTPDGMPSSIRGRGISPTRSWTWCTKYLIICSVTSKSLMTPSRSGRIAMMFAGRPADHPLRLGADRQDPLRLRVDRHDRRLAHDDAAVADVDERVGGPEVDPDVAGEEAEEAVEHVGGEVLRAESGRVAVAAAPRRAGARDRALGIGREARAVYPARPDAPVEVPRPARGASAGRQARAARAGRSNATPRSRSETYASWPMTRWSSRSMSSSRPAASASAVRWRSSGRRRRVAATGGCGRG